MRSATQRNLHIQSLQNEIFDLLIVGGGINGAGVAREAALRGMKVAVLEARDFAEGTSSRSSKLIHGGIRYLENLEFGLVSEALTERNRLFEMAPHLAHHLRFMIPIFEDSRVSFFKMGLGMWLYDALCFFQAPELHERLNKTETLSHMPILNEKNLKGSYIYSDGYMDDDRLVIETLRSAQLAGATLVNYCRVRSLILDSGKILGAEVEDCLTKKVFEVRCKHLVSGLGPWTDQEFGRWLSDWKPILRPTKGVHITLAKSRLPLPCAVVMGAEKSDRIVFGIPRHEMVIIGTTDTDYKGDPALVRVESSDVDYLLEVCAHHFPGAKLRKEDILGTYAGVRPLVKDHSSSEGKTSREHSIFSDERGLTVVAGGKYTTYRLMAEQIVEEALKFFSLEERVKFGLSRSVAPLTPWTEPETYFQSLSQIEQIARKTLLPLLEVRKLVERHGSEVRLFFERYPETYTYWQYEAAHAIENNYCLNIKDFFSRRSPLILSQEDHGMRFIPEVSEVFMDLLGLTKDQVTRQIEDLKSYIKNEMAWRSQPPLSEN